MENNQARAYWDSAARRSAAWYVSTGHEQQTEEFFRQGAVETDTFLSFCGVEPSRSATVLEVGCGVGRMTRRLSELFGQVIAVDVSEEMLRRCRENLSARPNVSCHLVKGDGTLDGVAEAEVDLVFSYLTFQHVPTAGAQLRYFENCARALRAGGKMAVQIRSSSVPAVLLTYAGNLGHWVRGRRTLDRSWRGSRVKASAVVEVLRAQDVEVTFRTWPHHPFWSPAHCWALGTKGHQL
ncbi:MAG: class I SAM-dependent methyltransferase [Acidimicrobiales bacterium]